MSKKSQFATMFENVLSTKLTEYMKLELTIDDLHTMREAIAECFLDTLKCHHYTIGEEAAQHVVCKYFESIQLGVGDSGPILMRDLIVSNDVELEHLSSMDIMTLREMMEGTFMQDIIETEFECRLAKG